MQPGGLGAEIRGAAGHSLTREGELEAEDRFESIVTGVVERILSRGYKEC